MIQHLPSATKSNATAATTAYRQARQQRFHPVLIGLVLVSALAASGCIGGNMRTSVGPDGETKTSYGKVVICHDGETMEVGRSQLNMHIQHGDRRSKCIPK